MYEYMTRQMVALREINYGDATLKRGEPFLATPDDVAYLTRAGKAREGQPKIDTVEVAKINESPATTVEVYPALAEVHDEAPADAADEAEAAVEDAATDDASDEVAPARRGRGRPRRNP